MNEKNVNYFYRINSQMYSISHKFKQYKKEESMDVVSINFKSILQGYTSM
jgi:hypothetical protein